MNKNYEQSVAVMIAHDVMTAVESSNKENVKAALESVKKIKSGNGEINIDIVKELSKFNITLIWGKSKDAVSETKRLGVKYKGIVFEVG